MILFYSYLIKFQNDEKFDFEENEYDEIVKKCIKLEEKNKIKSKKIKSCN